MSNKTHGLSRSLIYNTWLSMIRRCTDPKNVNYKNYGGRGITVCTKWLNFEDFHEDMGDRIKGMYLDRKNNDVGYCKDNCKWSTKKEQNNNKRTNVNITYKGKTQNLTQWAEELGINRNTLKSRINRSCWSIQKSFNFKSLRAD